MGHSLHMRRLAGVLVPLVALALLAAVAAPAHADDAVSLRSSAQVRAEGTNPRLGGKLAGYTAWVDAHAAAPDIVILGSSRAVQLDPELIERLSDATTYNAAVSSAAARELLAVSTFVELLTPHDVPHLVVLLDLEAFDRRNPTSRVSTVLQQEEELRRACTTPAPDCAAAWRAGARAIVREAVAAARGLPPASDNQRPDGMQVNGMLETLDAQGVDLTPMRERRIGIRIRSYRPGGGFDRLMPIPQASVATLLRTANARGDEPTVVLTAMHPDCIRRCGPAGWSARRQAVRAWLADQATRHRFELVDLSIPSGWGGSRTSFFDEIHLRPKAAAQVVRRLDGLGAFDVRPAAPAPSSPVALAREIRASMPWTSPDTPDPAPAPR